MAALVLSVTSAHAAGTRPVADAIVLGPSRCLDRDTLARNMATWLGRGTVDDRLAITVDEIPDGVRFVLRRDDVVVGERTLDVSGASCEEVDSAVALAVASALDATIGRDPAPGDDAPGGEDAEGEGDDLTSGGEGEPDDQASEGTGAVGEGAAGRPAPPAPVKVPSEVGDTAADEADAAPGDEPVDAPRSVVLALEGMVLAGVLPEITLAVSAAGSFAVTRQAELRLSAMVVASTTVDLQTSSGDADGSAKVGLYAGRVDACGGDDLLDGRIWLRGCGGIAVGAVPAEGIDVEEASSTVAPWVAVVARAEAQWTPPRSAVGLLVAVDGIVPAARPDLEARDASGNATSTREFPLIGVGVALGPCFRF